MMDNKLDTKFHQKKCIACGKESPTDCSFTEMAYYVTETSNLMMGAKLACSQCREEILSVRQFASEEGLVFGKNSKIFQQHISMHLAPRKEQKLRRQKQEQERLERENSIYHKHIQQEVKRNRLYHCKDLPQNCLQLVYYSSFSVSHAERHERVKNTIITLMEETSIPLGNIRDIAILVHYLTCYMHENNVIALLKLLYEKNLVMGSPVAPIELDSQIPTQRLWRCLYDKVYIGNTIVMIGFLLRHWEFFDHNIRRFQDHRSTIKSSQQLEDLTVVDYETDKNLKNEEQPLNIRKNLSFGETDHRSLEKGTEIKSDFNGDNVRQCQKCKKMEDEYLKELERVKNNFTLVLSSVLREEAWARECIVMIEQKYEKEKEELINKIIKLKDKLEVIEDNEGGEERVRRPRSASESKLTRIYKPDLEEVSEKSQGTIKTIQNHSATKAVEESGVGTSETEKPQENVKKQEMKKFHQLLMYLPEFDPSLLSPETSTDQILETLDSGIQKMSENLQKFDKKIRTLENQSKRLLGILSRKEERFVPLIHEKDEIIEKYQNALWRMENGLPVFDEALAPRIRVIFEMFKSEILETMTIVNMDEHSELKESPSKSSPQKKKKESKKEKKSKIVVKQEKQCQLF